MQHCNQSMKMGLVSIVVLISSCAISKETYLPDGTKGYSISCDGAAVGINVCFEKAGSICGARGYDIVNREGQIVPAGVGYANENEAFVNYGAYNTKSIMIRCRGQENETATDE